MILLAQRHDPIGGQPDSIAARTERLSAAVGVDNAFVLIEQRNRSGVAIQQLCGALLQGAQRAEPESDRQRLFQVAVQNRKPLEVVGFVSSHPPRAVQRNARLYGRRGAHLAHHAKADITVACLPIVVGMPIFLPLRDHQAIVDNRLVRMADKILDRWDPWAPYRLDTSR